MTARPSSSTPAMMSILGANADDIEEILKGLGYRSEAKPADEVKERLEALDQAAREAAQAAAAKAEPDKAARAAAAEKAASEAEPSSRVGRQHGCEPRLPPDSAVRSRAAAEDRRPPQDAVPVEAPVWAPSGSPQIGDPAEQTASMRRDGSRRASSRRSDRIQSPRRQPPRCRDECSGGRCSRVREPAAGDEKAADEAAAAAPDGRTGRRAQADPAVAPRPLRQPSAPSSSQPAQRAAAGPGSGRRRRSGRAGFRQATPGTPRQAGAASRNSTGIATRVRRRRLAKAAARSDRTARAIAPRIRHSSRERARNGRRRSIRFRPSPSLRPCATS